MRFRLGVAASLVDINRFPAAVEELQEERRVLLIGALVREHALEVSPRSSRRRLRCSSDTTRVIADPMVRKQRHRRWQPRARQPRQQSPGDMLAYDATVIARGNGGERTIAIDDFFAGLFENSLHPGEILVEIRVPRPSAGSGGAYTKLERKVGDYATAAVAVQLRLDGGLIVAARVGLTNVNPVPMRAKGAEAILVGKAPSAELYERAGIAAAAECDPSATSAAGSTTSATWSESSPGARSPRPSRAPREPQ